MQNDFFVGSQAGKIAFLRPIPQVLEKSDALNLAAWIVALADNDMGKVGGAFDKVLTEVLNCD